ncbi:hypothetical protein BB560_003514 [Smittium megazygosporum]|uniref:pantothenate kinase n=1 Tax=Smittium megazygosporum TaxID=133381 RepID=A0A2T9ZBS7_9FUNG|nr:hypothetical protein BB560_003514 [Smittium megazygosporum]
MLSNTEKNTTINLSGAVNENNSHGKISNIVMPNQTGQVSHIAVDIGGSMAKIVYFTTNPGLRGGRLNFEAFETDKIDNLISFMESLIRKKLEFPISNFSIQQNSSNNLQDLLNVNSLKELGASPQPSSTLTEPQTETLIDSPRHEKPVIKATGGGAHLFRKTIEEKLNVDVQTEDEMECLITGLNFFIHEVADEIFSYQENENPVFESIQKEDMFPYILVNIGSGVSIIKVTSEDKYERISGTSLGGGTFWGLLHLLTGSSQFDEMLEISKTGDNSKVDMMVGDIYGTDYDKIGLKATAIASTMGGVYRKKLSKKYDDSDIARSLLYMVSNTIGQIAYLNAQLHGINKIYFGGYFIRGHRLTMHTLSYAIKFWSKGTMHARFMRHEGFLGAVGAFIKADPSILPNRPTHRARGGSVTENFVFTQGLGRESVSGLGILDRVSTKLLPLPQLILSTNNPHPLQQFEKFYAGKPSTFSHSSDKFVYNPDTFDLLDNSELREYWINSLKINTENLISLASDGKLTVDGTEDKSILFNFQRMYLEKLETLKSMPSAFGKLSVRSLLNLREQSLHEVGCLDLFSNIKAQENEASLKIFPELVKTLDSINDKKALIEELFENALLGNMFDWGSNEIQQMIKNNEYKIDFSHLKKKVNFNSKFNNSKVLVKRLLEKEPYKKALVFVDNAGADTILGVIPFVRFLLNAGTKVILAANSHPALNDFTSSELMKILVAIAKLDSLINSKIIDKSLVVLGTGSSSPCLDLSRLNERLVTESHDVDFLVIIGMGRAIQTNYYSSFSIDSLKIAVFKSSIAADALGAKLYDSLCYFVPGCQ